MANHFLYRVIRLAGALGICSVVLGCVSTSVEQEVFMGEGFQSALPDSEARVLVWGNHSGATTRTLGWLHDHQIPAVDRSWVEKELTDPIFDRRTRMEQKKQVLAAAKSVGASLVLFTQVEDSQMGWKFDVMSFGHKRMKFIGVEIRGMKADTGDLQFGAKAWNSEPLAASEQLVMALTSFALEKAFNQAVPSLPVQETVQQLGASGEQIAGLSSSSDEVTASVLSAPQPVEDQSTMTSHISTQSVYAGSEETMGDVSTTLSTTVNEDISKKELPPFMSLQQNVPQQEKRRALVAGLTTLSDEELARVVPDFQLGEDPSAVLPQVPTESVVDYGNQEKTQMDMGPQESYIDGSTLEAELQPYQETSVDDTSILLQVTSGALSLLYAPVKMTYAMLGGFFGGFAYVLTAGNDVVAQSVWDASLRGDYWLTVKHLQGKEAIHFKGEPSSVRTVQQHRIDDAVVE